MAGILTKIYDECVFQYQLRAASQETGRDLAQEDDLMARFMARSLSERHHLVQNMNCYMWAAADHDLHKENIFRTPDGKSHYRAINPGDGAGIPCLHYSDELISLTNLWQLVRTDQARTVHVKPDAPLPKLQPHQRLIAGIVLEYSTGIKDYHFMAQGSSGYWSHMRSKCTYPSFFDDDNKLITDPRQAYFDEHNAPQRVLFFSVPQQGLPIKLDQDKVVSLYFNTIRKLEIQSSMRASAQEREALLSDAMKIFRENVPKPVFLRQLEGVLRRRYLMD